MLKRSIRGVALLLLLGLTLYLGLSLFLYLYQSHLIYLPDIPSRAIGATPTRIGLDYESVTLTTDDGITLDGWFVPHSKSRATLLFFHGNAGNISHRLESLKLFHQLGLAVLIIDYRGYGRSGGRPSEAGIYRDAEAAWRYLTEERKIPPRRILLYGRSFGGAVAGYLASRHQALGVVLESTFTSAPDLAGELYPWLPVRWLIRFDYDTRSRLQAIRMPVMVIHSHQDDLIPYHHGQTLYAEAEPPKRFLELNGSHNHGIESNASRYRQELDGFIAFCLRQKPQGFSSNSPPE
ncbi:MAG: alpha/beta hydrolase [Candidatus Thiodiazotropha sp.]|jgi:uncharacterized protein